MSGLLYSSSSPHVATISYSNTTRSRALGCTASSALHLRCPRWCSRARRGSTFINLEDIHGLYPFHSSYISIHIRTSISLSCDDHLIVQSHTYHNTNILKFIYHSHPTHITTCICCNINFNTHYNHYWWSKDKMHRLLQVAILLSLAASSTCGNVVELNNENFNFVDHGAWLVEL